MVATLEEWCSARTVMEQWTEVEYYYKDDWRQNVENVHKSLDLFMYAYKIYQRLDALKFPAATQNSLQILLWSAMERGRYTGDMEPLSRCVFCLDMITTLYANAALHHEQKLKVLQHFMKC